MLHERMAVNMQTREVSGYIAMYNEPTMFMGKTEVISPGAFDSTLQRITEGKHRVYALYNHGRKYPEVLAHTGNGSLSLSSDEKGLKATIRVVDGPVGDLVIKRVEEGFADGASFGFHQQDSEVLEYQSRRVLNKMNLREVTITEMPAYLQTASARSEYYDAPAEIVEPQVDPELQSIIDEVLGIAHE